ncbi:MAG: alpha/beta hydrolase [Candidatus Nezhaarchaeota archaeon]|nr:alpha/beta hydrolase [Candidatus Nezhaarchaeota archaeon]
MLANRTVEVSGLRLTYREAGVGPCSVLVHGALGSSFSWIYQLREAGRLGVRAVALDLPGHGGSQDLHGQACIEDYAAVVKGFIRALGLERPLVIGHSMGGAVALSLAISDPDLVGGLVLVNTGARLRVMREILEGLERSYEETVVKLIAPLAFAPSAPKWLVEASIKEMLKVPQRVAIRNFKACSLFDMRSRLSEVNAPTLIVAGSEDRLTPIKWAAYLHEGIKGSELRVVEGAGHVTMLEKHEVFNQILLSFTSRLRDLLAR